MPALLQVFGNHHPTLTTALAGILGVDFENASAGTLSLALADPHKLPPSCIVNTFIQASFGTGPIGQILPRRFILFRFGPPAHIGGFWIFQKNKRITPGKISGLLLGEKAALGSNVSVERAHLFAHLFSPRPHSRTSGDTVLL